MKEQITVKAIYVVCRNCGCEYLEDKSWFKHDNKTKCPMCDNVLEMDQ